MHHWLHTLTPHGDINKFEIEDGVIRQAVATLLSERSSITEVTVDIPRDASDQSLDVDRAEDNVLIAVSAEEAIDANRDISELVSDFATIRRSGSVDRLEIAARERSWPGTATPGTAVRLRAELARDIDTPSLTSWLEEALEQCAVKLPSVGIEAMVGRGEDALTSVNVSLTFPKGEDPTTTLSAREFTDFFEGEVLDPATLTADLFTEHRIAPNPQTWT